MMKSLPKMVGFRISVWSSAIMTGLFGVLATLVGIFSPFSLDTPKSIVGFLLIFSLVSILVQGLIVTLLSSQFIQKPLSRIISAMQKVERGYLGERCEIDDEDEFSEVGHHFNEMMNSLNEINESRKHIQQKLIKAEESLKYKVQLEEKAKIIERMNKELTGAFNDVSLLYTVSQYLNSILEIEELVQAVRKVFENKFKCDAFGLYFVDAPNQSVQLVSSKNLNVKESLKNVPQFLRDGLIKESLTKKRSIYISDIENSKVHRSSELEIGFSGSVLVIPLVVRNEQIATLVVSRRGVSQFTATDRQSLESIASQISVAYDRSRLYSKTKEMSVRDELTGVYNRRHFQQMLNLEMKRAERFDREVSLLMIDVDHFKKLNDTYGHLKGDELLKELTALLESSVREVDLVARYGGEEFVVLLTNTGLQDAVSVGNKLRQIIKSQLRSKVERDWGLSLERHGDVTISVGVSSYPDCSMTPRELLNTADLALYLAKKDGRDRVRSYQVEALPLEGLMA